MPKLVNLMQVVFTLEVGGLENLVVNLLGKLDRKKYNLSLCTLSTKGPLEDDINEMGLPVYRLQKREGIDCPLYLRLARLLRDKNIGIIHTHNPAPWFYAVIAGKLAGVKVSVHTEHSHLFFEQKKMMLAEKLLSRLTDVVISDSQKVTRFLIDKQGVDAKKIVTIFNGIDLGMFQTKIDVEEKKRELGIREGSLVIGNVARLEPVKNHQYLLDVFRHVTEQLPQAVLVIAGGGSQLKDLKRKVLEWGIVDKVYFLGTRGDIPELIKTFDVFALTSKSEGMPLSLLEAMACGKAVVATDVGGNPEVVVDGVTGFLLPLNDTHRLSEALISLLKNAELSKKMGMAGYKRAKELFSLETMVKRYEDVYDGWIKKRGLA